jgi:hypothetical protein
MSEKKDRLVGRDTIYIDTEDDITSIIEKVKESDNSVLALVPPKRVGALQSVVNLKLLLRAAKSGRKKVALVTTDAALIALAAGLRIPVAKNLTAQPELPEAPDLDDTDNDVINGDELAIGDLARSAEKPASRRDNREDKEISAAVAAIETDDRIKNDADGDGAPDDAPRRKSPKAKRVPNFNDFRKKLLIFGSLGLALIVFLIWAIVFAPHGTITITAETMPKEISTVVSLRPSAATNLDNKIIQPIIKQIKKTETVNFTATGSKDVGEKATGEVNVYNDKQIITGYTCNAVSISAGTTMIDSVSGLQFTLDKAVSVPCDDMVKTTATAVRIGENYNIKSNVQLNIAGYNPSTSKIYAVANGDFTGGSQKTVKVVQQSDIDAATEKLKEQVDQDKIKSELIAQMGSDVTTLDDSFTAAYGTINSKPALDEAVDSGSAAATMEITYTLIGITKTDLKNLIEAEIGEIKNQKIYNDGVSKIRFDKFAPSGNNYTVTVKTTAQIGPDLDKRQNQIKESAVGKRSGEIVSDIEAIAGVSSVKVKFSPFWVSTAPAANKLTVEFAVNE